MAETKWRRRTPTELRNAIAPWWVRLGRTSTSKPLRRPELVKRVDNILSYVHSPALGRPSERVGPPSASRAATQPPPHEGGQREKQIIRACPNPVPRAPPIIYGLDCGLGPAAPKTLLFKASTPGNLGPNSI